MAYRIEYYPRAESELQKIHGWIARQVGPLTAEQVIRRIAKKLRRLETFPGAGRRDPHNPGYLFFVASNHRFYYRIEDESRRIVIVRIFPATLPPPVLGD